ncbi:hypothetical protein FCM35_KLT02170 [Carex littledalei]|uniref:Uncharacterized protein n=1 Tax=Carex littledalei TaxID=544730 RepID=A0A833VRU2_9POAL|nr:hypothetical protein FCM35_KLT02170 [Carex littledalei]
MGAGAGSLLHLLLYLHLIHSDILSNPRWPLFAGCQARPRRPARLSLQLELQGPNPVQLERRLLFSLLSNSNSDFAQFNQSQPRRPLPSLPMPGSKP